MKTEAYTNPSPINAVRFLRDVTCTSTDISHSGSYTNSGPEISFKAGDILVIDGIAQDNTRERDTGILCGDNPWGLCDLCTQFRSYLVPLDCFEEVELVVKE